MRPWDSGGRLCGNHPVFSRSRSPSRPVPSMIFSGPGLAMPSEPSSMRSLGFVHLRPTAQPTLCQRETQPGTTLQKQRQWRAYIHRQGRSTLVASAAWSATCLGGTQKILSTPDQCPAWNPAINGDPWRGFWRRRKRRRPGVWRRDGRGKLMCLTNRSRTDSDVDRPQARW